MDGLDRKPLQKISPFPRMRKTHTKKRRSHGRLTRRLRRTQRGGGTIEIEVDDYQMGPIGLAQLTVEENSTPRSVLKQWIQASQKIKVDTMRESFLRYADKKPSPNFVLFDAGKGVEKLNWDEPYSFQPNKRYKFMFSAKQQAQNNFKATLQDATEYLLKAIQHYADKKTPAKIIPFSYSVDEDDIVKNVNQTFKFLANPKTPILLYDIAWFEKEGEEWQFYNLLEFEESVNPAIGPKEYVRFYKKPAGKAFTIKGPTSDYKEAYLAEVLEKAEKGGFDERSELEICCVKWKFDKNDPQMNEKEERIFRLSETTRSPMYSFGSINIPDIIEYKRKKRQEEKEGKGNQKGGKQIFLKGNSGGKTMSVEITDTTTPYNVLMQYANETINTNEGYTKFKSLVNADPPLITLRQGSRNLHIKNLKNHYNFQNQGSYNVYIHKSRVGHLQLSKTSRDSFEVLKDVLHHLRGGKIITESAAITDAIEKNVKQQFMFHKQPHSPIVLIDGAFFSTDLDTYDFYKYLNFEEFTVPGIKRSDIVKFFKKPAGVKLGINKSYPEIPLAEKVKYYMEVLNQATFDINKEEVVIACVKHYFSSEEKANNSALKNYIKAAMPPDSWNVYVWSA